MVGVGDEGDYDVDFGDFGIKSVGIVDIELLLSALDCKLKTVLIR